MHTALVYSARLSSFDFLFFPSFSLLGFCFFSLPCFLFYFLPSYSSYFSSFLHKCTHTQNVHLKIKKEGKENMAEGEGKGERKRQREKRKSKKKEKEERKRGRGTKREWETDIRGREKEYNVRSWEEGNREEYSAKKSKP